MRFHRYPAIFFLLYVFTPTALAAEGLPQSAPSITLNSPTNKDDKEPAYISAQQLKGVQGEQLEATGAVELRQGKQAIFADHLTFTPTTNELTADGAVRIEQPGTIIEGSALKLNLDKNVGDMTQPTFQFTDIKSRGSADNFHMLDRQTYLLHNVSYTTCPAGNDDWLLRLGKLEIDRGREVGTAQHARVEFMGVPILYTPWMDFPLGDRRKSGFLAPIPGRTLKNGNELTLPYYWNIAPNRDATFTPRAMSQRGTLLSNDFRYLEPTFSGKMDVDGLQGDRQTHTNRLRAALQHNHHLGKGLSASANLNYVSDDAYFRDLGTTVSSTSQTNLERAGILSYRTERWNASLRAQAFQTLQDPVIPVVEPYQRMPQITLNGQQPVAGASFALTGEYVDFRHPTLINAQRLVLHPSVSYPLVAHSAFYITPKVGVHSTQYTLTKNNPAATPSIRRTVPIYSVDSGIAFERDFNLVGQDYLQTLEPRAFYVYAPYRAQDSLPNFDTAQSDFSFTQMFSENRFFGHDRISDANHLTLALTSRLLQQDSGAERLRLIIGQRFNQGAPQASLAQVPNKSDILMAATGRITKSFSLDSNFQYDPNKAHSEKLNITSRYHPESGKALNLGYRYTRDKLEQSDLSIQWPLTRRWYMLGRWNYSILDKRSVESVAGLEYNDRCWTARMIVQRFAVATNEVSTGIFLQLELNDLLRVGSDPLAMLRQSIPGFTKTNSLSNKFPAE